ncbi:fasciclin domain-containing protein [Natronoflexus pectinivorans]|uniref:Putative surface protein with fasciclin (FAS1) repeats n=1 Tax=Natronoflexus pectinivorans TaxID=682526 RepID=A0A4R2GMC6_9BACT|nr:fasciclin domain-containing protein [Natronoflexus pectinivorans]TCO09868.1 putative surface protein with fasciclin (FAS1) repeats [Natronoflexus pectinivorans]
MDRKNIFNQKRNILKVMNVLTKSLAVIMLVLSVGFFSGCNDDDIGENYYTFRGETIGQYIEARPERFSEFEKMLELSGVMGLLNAYGRYTVFLPENDAMLALYSSRGKSSVEDFPVDTIRRIVHDHIIRNFEVPSMEFTAGTLPYLTMTGRSLNIQIQSTNGGYNFVVNELSVIRNRDIAAHNGIIHVIDKVIEPSDLTVVEAFSQDDQFSLMYQALIETELYQELLKIRDEDYVIPAEYADLPVTNNIGSLNVVPQERLYGFTIFAVSDDTFAEHGINSLEDMAAYAATVYDRMYPNDSGIEDITNRRNSLNRFIAYHLVNKKLPRHLLIEAYDNTGSNPTESHSVKSVDMFEYIEPMAPNTLLEVRTLRDNNEYDVFNMIPSSGQAVRLVRDNVDNDALNGVYHEIDGILIYNEEVEQMLSSKRIRMNSASFFPELTNNNIRVGNRRGGYPSERYYFPRNYIERVDVSETTEFGYFNSDDRFVNYQGDEVFLIGMYEFTIVTPPVPPGTYEVRFGFVATGNRGAAQLYWNGIPSGIPLDLSRNAGHASIGYIPPGSDPNDPEGFENDRMMRNRGYMKAPASFRVINGTWYGHSTQSARQGPSALRRILGIYTFDEAKNHEFTVRAARSGEFMFDYLEFVPVEVLEFEDIY